ncbi:hypothetical protein DB88DRAFT_488907 [Papiliotrema laurentii]|uniref:Enoyl reductase (ER) domain-containing protein n=1 Tax=Papiliotrema laurentii TaxID=5418 RepID=A0AAD9D0Y6_PAPLA|nr:hypothetical protein DB88DRAFT_488907 [Papiliotrema laurentii]
MKPANCCRHYVELHFPSQSTSTILHMSFLGPRTNVPLSISSSARPRLACQVLCCGRQTVRPKLQFQSVRPIRHFSGTSSTFDKMRCILIKDGKGPAENLYLGEEETPLPKQGEVQVKIKTFGLNRMDLLQREGQYPLPPQASKTIMGVEFAGVVTKLGEGASKFKEGDEVFGLAFGGAYAEYIISPEQMLLHKPKSLGWAEAGGIPENWMTAYQALFLEGGLQKGQNVLIHAGASGVGVAAIQLALHVGQANKVFTTCGTDEKVEFLKRLGGGDERLIPINYRTQQFEEEIKKHEDGVDLIVDFIGKNYFTPNLNSLRRDGTLVFLAMMSGPKLPADTNIIQILFKRLTLKGSTLRSRTTEYQADLLQRFEKHALGLITEGKMKVEIHEVFPWDKVIEAQKEMEANKNSGKIVFEIPE